MKLFMKKTLHFLKYDVQVKDIYIKDLKNQLEEALKKKDDLKLKLEKFEESSKNLTKLINSQISGKDKSGLGYDSQMNESEVAHSVFNSRESDVDDSLVNYRFKTGKWFHAVPPSYTGNYMSSRPDLSFVGLDDSVYKTKVSETETSISKTSKDIVEKPKIIRPSAPIIEDWKTNSDNDSVFRPKSDQTKRKFTKINFVKSDENVKSVNKENTHRQVEYPRKSQSPRDNRRIWNVSDGVNLVEIVFLFLDIQSFSISVDFEVMTIFHRCLSASRKIINTFVCITPLPTPLALPYFSFPYLIQMSWHQFHDQSSRFLL
ncbi:hypothetical protein Tco_0669745 [Tanacetum coccineum]